MTTIVVCDKGNIQTCASHTEILVVNFLSLQLSSYAFTAFLKLCISQLLLH